VVSTPPETTPTIKISENVRGSDEIVEAGLAELIEGTDGNRKYLALHRTAPAGTILKIRNEMNNREVFVRVMGKLPDTALTDKLVIKISKSAYDRLGAIDQRFRVEVTYYK
ncbi:MAG TPA: peptidoglycan-binding protein, partial [Cyclobacteriaceae bacterium]